MGTKSRLQHLAASVHLHRILLLDGIEDFQASKRREALADTHMISG